MLVNMTFSYLFKSALKFTSKYLTPPLYNIINYYKCIHTQLSNIDRNRGTISDHGDRRPFSCSAHVLPGPRQPKRTFTAHMSAMPPTLCSFSFVHTQIFTVQVKPILWVK